MHDRETSPSRLSVAVAGSGTGRAGLAASAAISPCNAFIQVDTIASEHIMAVARIHIETQADTQIAGIVHRNTGIVQLIGESYVAAISPHGS